MPAFCKRGSPVGSVLPLGVGAREPGSQCGKTSHIWLVWEKTSQEWNVGTNSKCATGKLVKPYLHQVVQLPATRSKSCWTVPWDRTATRRVHLWYFPPKPIIKRKHQEEASDKLKGRNIPQNSWPDSSGVPRAWGTGEGWETVTAEGTKETRGWNATWCPGWNLDQEKDLRRKSGKIQIKTDVWFSKERYELLTYTQQ